MTSTPNEQPHDTQENASDVPGDPTDSSHWVQEGVPVPQDPGVEEVPHELDSADDARAEPVEAPYAVAGSDTAVPVEDEADTASAESSGEEVSEEQAREIITEALGPRLSRRAILTASGLVVAVALGTGLVAGLSSDASRSVEMSSLTNTNTAEVAPRDSSGVAAEASASVFQIQAGNQTGSSFLVEPTVLMTNAHVTTVDVGGTVDVISSTGEELTGTVLMKDTAVDVALVEIPKQSAEPLQLVGVREQSAGQPITLIGYPLGLDVTVTTGVASAIDTVTSLRESSGQHSLLQIDAAVNPGSSGGPVLDSRGRVMGMATSRPDSVGSRPVQGVSFAVPSNDLTVAVRQFNEHGDVRYGYLGVSMNSAQAGGAVIEGVTADSPAASAGLKEGEVIVAVGEYETPSYTEVSRFLHMFRPGDEVKITVKSGDKNRTVNVVLGENG